MKGKPQDLSQKGFFTNLEDTLNPRHPLYQLSERIPWEVFEREFSRKYKKTGRPSKPIRLMVSLMILKQMHDLSDEQLVRGWVENPYWQYFSGSRQFQWKFPCDPSEMTYFRRRIGKEGAELILEVSAKMHGSKALEEEIVPDTTVQEKNITFPTDTKLHIKTVRWVWRIAEKEEIKLRQSYKRTIPKLLWTSRHIRSKKRKKEAMAAKRKINTLGGRLVRDIERKMGLELKEKYKQTISNCYKILEQKQGDQDKLYSLHEPEVSCIAKGKEHKKYEFGSKVSILLTKNSGIIVGAKSFQGNPYDGNTLEEALSQYKKLFGKMPSRALVDEGYRGKNYIGEPEILRVHQKKKPGWSRWRWKERFKRRASVEAAIAHLKNDYRMRRNYLKGSIGDSINLMMSCAAFNFAKYMRELAFYLQKLIAAMRKFMPFSENNRIDFEKYNICFV